MAQADKSGPSTGKVKSKTSFLDDDLSKDFLGSWNTMSVAGGDDMDFNFEPVAKGKKNKAFDFGMDTDFSLDDAFGKMSSFKFDMPDIDFSSPPKESSNENKSEKKSADQGSRPEKNDKSSFKFDMPDIDFSSPPKESSNENKSEKKSADQGSRPEKNDKSSFKFDMPDIVFSSPPKESSNENKSEKKSADQGSRPEKNDKSSFKFDMPDIDFSSPPKESSNEKKSEKKSADQGSRPEKNDKSSFKFDMPDIDFSSPPKESSNEKKSADQGSHPEKNDKFNLSFNFDGDGDNNKTREIRNKMVADTSRDGHAEKDALQLQDKRKMSIDTKPSGGDPSSEGNGQRLQDNPSLHGKDLMKQDSFVEKEKKNVDASRDDDNIENGANTTKTVVDSLPSDGQVEKDELHLPDNRKKSTDVKSSWNKEFSFVEAFGKIPSFKLDMPDINSNGSSKQSSKFKENISEKETQMGNLQQKRDKLSLPPRLAEETNAAPISKKEEVIHKVQSLGDDDITSDTVAFSETNMSKTVNSEVAYNAEMQRPGLKDSSAPSGSEPTPAKPMSTRSQVTRASSFSMVRSKNYGFGPKLPTIERMKKGLTPLGAANSGVDLNSGGYKMDDNSGSCAQDSVKQKSDSDKGESNVDNSRDGDNKENDETRDSMVSHPVSHDGPAKKDGVHSVDDPKMNIADKSASIRLPSLVAPKGVSKSSSQGNEKFKGKITSMSTQQSNVGQVSRLPSGRIDQSMPSLPSLRISRNTTPTKKSYFSIAENPISTGTPEKSPRLQVKSRMVSPVNLQKQTPSMPSLKRKPAEAADLHPSKRLSPGEIRKSKVSSREVEDEDQTQGIEGSKPNVAAQNLSPKFDFHQEGRMEIPGFTLMVESDVNVEKAEACAKELDDICSMLKKKQEEAKELLVRTLINNNNLLMLNHPIYEEKIREVQRFASRLMSREQEAGV